MFKDPGPRGRMLRGVLSNVYDKSAVTFVQFVSIPVLTAAWGAEGYGIWLMLLTVPTYIALSDLGFGTAAGIILTQCASKGELERANVVLQSTIAFVMGTVTIAAAGALGYAYWYAHHGAAEGPFAAGQISLAILFITAYALIMTQMSIVTVVYRATHKFAQAMVFAGTWIMLEGSALAVLSYFGADIVVVAAAYMLIRLCGYILFVARLKRYEPWVKIGIGLANRTMIRELASPSAAALGLVFAIAVSLQGMILALGASAGTAVVALFGASRMLSRAPLQLAGMVIRPSIPELTRAITEGNKSLERRLDGINLGISLAVTIPFGILLIVIGPWLLGQMSHGAFETDRMLFGLLSFAAAVNATWTALATPLISMNRQGEFAHIYLVGALLSVVVIVLISNPTAHMAALTMCLLEVAVLVRVVQRRMRTSTQGSTAS
ncbi:lipopolysaccharide biosynthesis protein [Rhodobacter lacus]|uniref:Lipopolysaccharide biosynthesis protein n=1 Tax=Rhodobacter lacus TaxID=1641972 RepID=A0ABW5ADW3_9RHOB